MTNTTKQIITSVLFFSIMLDAGFLYPMSQDDITDNILSSFDQPKSDTGLPGEKTDAEGKKAPEKAPEWLEGKEDEVEIPASEYSGNWYLKKQRLNEARKLYASIREIEETIIKKKDSFIKERTDLNNELNAFYINFSFQQSDIDAILNQLSQEIEGYEKEYGGNEEIKETLERLNARKKALEDLRSELIVIDKYDKKIDEGLNTFMKQEELARSYEQGAWVSYEKLEKAIDDTTSKQLYYEVKAALDNIKNIEQYGNVSFTSFLQDIIGKLHASIKKVKDTLEELKKHGITLQQAIDDAEKKKAEEEIKQKEKAAEEKQKTIAKKPQKKSWWQRIMG